MKGEGGLSLFSVKNFLSLLVPKNFAGEPVIVTQNFRYRKILGIRGGESRFSVEKILSHSAEKFHRGTFLCSVSENFW